MSNIPVAYFTLTILLAGIAFYSFLQFTYMYLKLQQKVILLPLLFSCAALIYTASDACALTFASGMHETGITNIFILFREISVLLFIILLQYYVSSIPLPNSSISKLNTLMMWGSVAAFFIICGMTAYDSTLLIRHTADSGDIIGNTYLQGRDMGPLLIARNMLLIIYAVYSLIIIVFYGLAWQDPHSARHMTAGIIIIAYFLSFHLYFIIFTPENAAGGVRLPFFGLGIVSCLIIITLGRIKTHADNVAQLEAAKINFEHTIYNDPSLGIPGRIAFQRDIQDELIRITSGNDTLFLVYFDIDDFRSMNECYGESVGDEILKMLTKRILDLFYSAGDLYRMGGDEFIFLLRKLKTPAEACDLAGKIISCLRNPFHFAGLTCLITASAGVLQLPRDGNEIDTILSNAYMVLGNAKKTKNTCEVFTQDLLDISNRKINIVNILRNGIARDQFTLFYQPIVDHDKNLIHAESLLRYTGKETTIGGPDTYLPILEDAGLMKDVDNMVTQKAFRNMEMKIRNRFSTSINLSTTQLVNPAYGDFLSSFATQHGIEKNLIVLEVTENRLMENLETGRDSLARLKKSGFKIAIDDFGKGFSSLSYLVSLPVDILKMDMVFTHSVPGDRRKEAVVRHIMELAHSLDLQVIAEGFETKEQFEYFKFLGCDLFQGYYFARPMPIDELLSIYP